MRFRRNAVETIEEEPPPPPPVDPTAWLISGPFPEFLLMHTNEIRYMAMLGYTFLHGAKLFPTFPKNASFSFKFVSMMMRCTGGGILVPIFINAVPVPLAQDAYPVAILTSFLLHQYFPILRDVLNLSPILKAAVIVLYETMRAYVVTKLTAAAAAAIVASDFSIPLFGPIFCGTVAGCGGAFLPLDKGLEPIKTAGLAQPMLSAFLAATFFHLFCQTSLSDGVVEAKKKAHITVTCFFIAWHIYLAGLLPVGTTTTTTTPSSTPSPAPASNEESKPKKDDDTSKKQETKEQESKKEESKKEESKKNESKKDDVKKDASKKDEPKAENKKDK